MIPELSSKGILWDGSEGWVEASSFNLDGYPTAFRLRSHVTGEVRVFNRVALVRDGEGDITHADYTAQTDFGVVRLRIYND